MSLKIIVLISLLLCTVNSVRFLEDTPTEEEIVAQLNYPREILIDIALATQEYLFEMIGGGTKNILDGLEFILEFDDQALKENIAFLIKESEGIIDINKLKEIANVPKSSDYKEYRKYLESMTKEKLIELALAADKYSRIKNGKEDSEEGDLSNYINKIEKRDIIKIIEILIQQFPELSKNNLLENLANKSLLSYDQVEAELNKKEQKDLAKIAILSQRYHKRKHHENLITGLNDFVYSLSEKNIINAIMSLVENNPELSSKNKLNDMLSKELQKDHPIIGGLEDYAHLYAKAELMEMCYKAEEHDRKERGIKGAGGLSDYLWRLSKDQVLKILIDYIKVYPVLRQTDVLETKAGLIEGGILKFLENKSVEDLKRYCLSVEDYTKKQEHKEDMVGGLNDYIDVLSKNDLINYIIEASDKYNELIKPGKLDQIAAKKLYIS